jgi:hypothetical protein
MELCVHFFKNFFVGAHFYCLLEMKCSDIYQCLKKTSTATNFVDFFPLKYFPDFQLLKVPVEKVKWGCYRINTVELMHLGIILTIIVCRK